MIVIIRNVYNIGFIIFPAIYFFLLTILSVKIISKCNIRNPKGIKSIYNGCFGIVIIGSIYITPPFKELGHSILTSALISILVSIPKFTLLIRNVFIKMVNHRLKYLSVDLHLKMDHPSS